MSEKKKDKEFVKPYIEIILSNGGFIAEYHLSHVNPKKAYKIYTKLCDAAKKESIR